MANIKSDSFPNEVAKKLKWYVYRLIDPRNGETFYVGKGCGNRVFNHVHEENKFLEDDSESKVKIKRIRDIRTAGLEVIHIIHRHGMNEDVAEEVESALIDAYPGLSNQMRGIDANARGTMTVKQVIEQYKAPEAKFSHLRLLLINVPKSASGHSTYYEATRYAWKLNPKKAQKAQFVLAVDQGMIRDVFEADRWLEATIENFPGRVPVLDRFGFEGRHAPPDILKLYKDKRIPETYRKPGAQNPVKYTWK